MRGFPLTLVALICGGFSPLSVSAPELTPEELLLEQIQVGEYSNRSDIVEQALYRLESIDPKNPELIAAKIRFSLRQNDRQKALQELENLKAIAPDSDAYKQAKASVAFSSDEGQHQVENARLLVRTGNLQAAKEAYDKLFKDNVPSIDMAVEYWQLIARLPGQRATAIQQLENLDRKTPGYPNLRETLVGLLFDNGENQRAFELLQKMASDTSTKETAAGIWLERIKAMPVGKESVAGIQRYLALYNNSAHEQEAKSLLEEQRKDLANPAFVARQDGLAMVGRGEGARAIPALKKAMADTPNDAQIAAALATAYEREGNRSAAISYYERANRLDNNSGRWNDDIQENRYWLLIKQGDNALKEKRLELAAQRYRQANALNPRDTEALLGLGDVAAAGNNGENAIRYYRQVLRMEPDNSRALNKMTGVYLARSPEAAYAYLNSLSPRQRAIMRGSINSLRSDILQKEAEALANQQRWPEVVSKLTEARALTPQDVWLNYRLARAMWESGNKSAADELLNRFSAQRPNDPDLAYVHALYLSGTVRTEEALRRLENLPRTEWNKDLAELDRRLTLDNVLETAQRMRDSGDESGAIFYLQRQPQDTRIDITLADWATERGDYQTALALYHRTLEREPDNEDAALGEAESYVALDEQDKAWESLARLGEHPDDSVNVQRRIANAWLGAGDPQRADSLYQVIRKRLQGEKPSQDSALAWRDIARAERAWLRPQQALDDYRRAMAASGIAATVPTDNDNFTRLTRSQANDDWLKRGIRSDAEDLYRQQNTTVTLDLDYWGSSGTKGISDLTAQTTMLEVETPLYDGRLFARTDYVVMNAGKFSTESDGKYYEKFGACYELGCDRDFRQKASGASVGVGWHDDRWNMDVGTTPFGFEVVDWVGGVSYKKDFLGLGWTFTASRRPLSSSLLSFAGAKDPVTGTTWGGARATGGAISLSYDKGEADGVWADLSAHQISGKNVEDNQRARLMGGYYRRLINEVDREVTVGLNSMLWHYDKDLSGYTLGQGGYYSPQSYFSLSVPLNYRQRTENWSWELAGSVSWSTSTTHDERRYPVRKLVSGGIPDADAIESGSSGSGFGYTARALVERRLTSHWSVGAGIDIQEAKDYTPSHALLFLRYNFNGWRGNMDMPPRPLTPYADFK